MTENLKHAYLDQMNRGDCIRVFPPNARYNTSTLSALKGLEKETLGTFEISRLNKANQMELQWFRGKCAMEESFC
jgi:hypothetical protein